MSEKLPVPCNHLPSFSIDLFYLEQSAAPDFGARPHHVRALAARIPASKERTHFWMGSDRPGMSTNREASVAGSGNSRLLVLPKRCQRRREDGKYCVFMVKAG